MYGIEVFLMSDIKYNKYRYMCYIYVYMYVIISDRVKKNKTIYFRKKTF